MNEVKEKPKRVKKERKSRAKPIRRVFGRLLKTVEIAPAILGENGEVLKPATLKAHWFELKVDGLHVRRFHARRRTERTWTFQRLANIAKTQMELFV